MTGAQPSAADLRVIVNYMERQKLFTLEAVADAIVKDEEQLPDNIPPAPQAREAATRITEIPRHAD